MTHDAEQPVPREGADEPDVPETVAEHDEKLVDEWGVESFPASDPPANW